MLNGISGSLFRWDSNSQTFFATPCIDVDARVSGYRKWEGELGSIEKLLRQVQEAASKLQRLHTRVESMVAVAVDARWSTEAQDDGPWNGHSAVIGSTVQAFMTCVSLVIKVRAMLQSRSNTFKKTEEEVHSMYGAL